MLILDFACSLGLNIVYPYLEFCHSTLFETVALNNAVDVLALVTSDLIVAAVLFPVASVVLLVPQLVLRGGAHLVYCSFTAVDTVLKSNGFHVEPTPVVVKPPAKWKAGSYLIAK